MSSLYRSSAAPEEPVRVADFGSPLWTRVRLAGAALTFVSIAIAGATTLGAAGAGALALPAILVWILVLNNGAFGQLTLRPAEGVFVARPFGFFGRELRVPIDEVLEAVIVPIGEHDHRRLPGGGDPSLPPGRVVAHSLVLRLRSGQNAVLYRSGGVAACAAMAKRAAEVIEHARGEREQ